MANKRGGITVNLDSFEYQILEQVSSDPEEYVSNFVHDRIRRMKDELIQTEVQVLLKEGKKLPSDGDAIVVSAINRRKAERNGKE